MKRPRRRTPRRRAMLQLPRRATTRTRPLRRDDAGGDQVKAGDAPKGDKKADKQKKK